MNDVTRALWAKSDPPHPLWKHLLDVAATTRALLPRFGPIENVPPEWVCYLNALHDIGKADPWFQNKNEIGYEQLDPLMKVKLPPRSDHAPDTHRLFRHEARSGQWVCAHLKSLGWSRESADVIEKVIFGHHGDFAPQHFYKETAQAAIWNPWREELAAMLREVLQVREYSLGKFANASTTGMTWSGLLVLADWIASNDELLRYSTLSHLDEPREYSQEIEENARHAVESLGFSKHAATSAATHFADIWPHLKPLHDAQQVLETLSHETIAPGLAILEEQMGRGKTESAIFLAEHWNAARDTSGVYLALPTQATGNQMHRRYQEYLSTRFAEEKREARLVHGMAWLLDDETPQNAPQTSGDQDDNDLAREWFRPLRRALLASDGVGTVDQVLMAALHVRFGPLRLLGLNTKVLIVDECHAYDAYMSSILQRLLQWCRALHIPVILLTATLSKKQKRALLEAYGATPDTASQAADANGYPLFTFVDEADGAARCIAVETKAPPRRVALQKHAGILDNAVAIARLALQQIENGGCACVLMNTVKGAQQVFREVQRLIAGGEYSRFQKDEHCTLFHARFRAAKRNELEKRITDQFGKDATLENGKRPQRALVVATQVIEQSLDVDFDVFLSQIAPIDLLLQRSGRQWRHQRKHRPIFACTFHILLPELKAPLHFGITGKIYAREVLLRTASVLHATESWVLPRDFRCSIEAVYGDSTPTAPFIEAADLEKATQENEQKIADEAQLSRQHKLIAPDAERFCMVRRGASESPENEGANPLRASTRLGDKTRPALLLHDPAQQKNAAAAGDFASRDVMKQMFLQKANVPTWWLANPKAAEGYDDIYEGEGWLRFHVIIALREGVWRRADGARIVDDETLGVFFEPPNGETKTEEADAGAA